METNEHHLLQSSISALLVETTNVTTYLLTVRYQQTWECIDINDRISPGHIFYDDVNAKQVEAERLLKPDGQTPKLFRIWLEYRLF